MRHLQRYSLVGNYHIVAKISLQFIPIGIQRRIHSTIVCSYVVNWQLSCIHVMVPSQCPHATSHYLDQYLHHAKRHAKPQNHHSELYAVDRGARLGSVNYQIIPSSFIPSQTTKSHNFVLSDKTLAWCICSTQSNFDEEYSTLHLKPFPPVRLTCVTWKYAMGLVSGSHSFDCSGKTFTEENYHYAYTSF